MRPDDETWLLSFYRASELAGAAFFGRLARLLPQGPLRRDMTKHFTDESQHASYWTACLDRLGLRSCETGGVYQGRYLEAVGVPRNMMECLAITLVFERRVMQQYARHARLPSTHPEVRRTLELIMRDERWHISWVRDALRGLEPRHGADVIAATLSRYGAADRDVYSQITTEHADRIRHILAATPTHEGASR